MKRLHQHKLAIIEKFYSRWYKGSSKSCSSTENHIQMETMRQNTEKVIKGMVIISYNSTYIRYIVGYFHK